MANLSGVDALAVASRLRDIIEEYSKQDVNIILGMLELWNNGRAARGD